MLWNLKCSVASFLKTLSPLFMDGFQLSQSYRATSRGQFSFFHLIPRNSWQSFYRTRKDERLSVFEQEIPGLRIQRLLYCKQPVILSSTNFSFDELFKGPFNIIFQLNFPFFQDVFPKKSIQVFFFIIYLLQKT